MLISVSDTHLSHRLRQRTAKAGFGWVFTKHTTIVTALSYVQA